MSNPGTPSLLDHPDRLAALDGTELVDTPPEAVFDRAVQLATRVLGTPVGLLSLVDGRRQFFKAQVGLTEPYAVERETPLSHSFCQYVVGADEPLVVRDARDDRDLQENLAISDLGVVAYLGVPVHDADGHVLGSFCAIDGEPRDWTEEDKVLLEDIAIGVESEIALRQELRKRIEAEEKSASAQQHLNLALRAGRLGTFDFDPRTGRTQWDKNMCDLWWIDPETTDKFEIAQNRVHPDDQASDRALREAALDPEGDGHHSAELRIVHPQTGEIRWLHIDGDVTFDNGTPVRVVGTAREITDRKRAEQQNELLTQELNHRVKNLFAVTSGMISLTARSTETTREMAEALNGRVQALARAHELIQPAIIGRPDLAETTTLAVLIEAVLKPHISAIKPEGLEIKGPAIELKPRAASSLALVLHELATNAQKYGAFSTPRGELKLGWTLGQAETGEEGLLLSWDENVQGQYKKDPTMAGFGTVLIKTTIEGQLNGKWSKSFNEDGFSCLVTIPVIRLRQ